MVETEKIQAEQTEQAKSKKSVREIPKLRVGQIVRVHERIKEGKRERIQIFEGLIIAKKHGQEPGATFTVRRVSNGFGVEKIFPLHLPTLEKVVVVSFGKTRRAKLYYMRKRVGREIKLKEKSK